MLAEFEMRTPRTLPEALQYLANDAPEAVPLAGGTNLVVDLRDGRHRPRVLVNIAPLQELGGIQQQNGSVVAGGGVTITELLHHPLIAETAPILQQAARLFANPLIRNRATLGGNLADASPAADTVPPLLALGAEVELSSQSGSRFVPLDEFFLHVRQTVRRPDELVGRVRWPLPAARSAMAYYKLGLRKADAISVVSLALMVESGEDGVCRQARIALGSVAPRPLRAHAAEDALRGQPLTAEVIQQAGRLAAEAASPISDLRASAGYRRQMVETLTCRLLKQLAGQVTEQE